MARSLSDKVMCWIIRFTLQRVASYDCPDRIPRSGKDGEDLRCYSTRIYAQGNQILLLRKAHDQGVSGLFFDKNTGQYSNEASIPYPWIKSTGLEIDHYIGSRVITYRKISDFLLRDLSQYYTIQYWLSNLKKRISQFFFNKTSFVTKRRIELLAFIVKKYTEDGKQEFSSYDIMDNIYSWKWFRHPDSKKQRQIVELYLDSFEESGELKGDGYRSYKITAKAVLTLEIYENSERRHLDNISMQKKMIWVTLILAIMAFFQSGLIKLPVLIDFNKLFGVGG